MVGLDRDVAFQLVVFLIGQIALLGQLYQQLRRAKAMLRSEVAIFVNQCKVNHLKNKNGGTSAPIFSRSVSGNAGMIAYNRVRKIK